jgi:hypothetical protein
MKKKEREGDTHTNDRRRESKFKIGQTMGFK